MIIAEIGTAHSASFEKAKQLIDAAANAGADAVKFQWVYADELLHPETGTVDLPCGSIRLYDRFKQLEVTPDFFANTLAYAHKKQLQFICSPFGVRSLRELIAIHPDAVKIASPELNHFPLLKALADYRTVQKALGDELLPIIVSSGVSKLRDIESALDIIGKENVTLLHCITSYPAPESEYNVRLVQTLHDIFGVPCGISDHSLDPALVPACAAACGSVMTEKHITLSKETDGLDDAVALDGEQFSHMVHALHQCKASIARYGKKRGSARILKELRSQYGRKKVADVLGTGVKTLATSERENYGRTNRSLHFMRAMKAGEALAEHDIAILRTEKILTPGISPEYFETILNARLAHDVQAGAGVQWKDLVRI
ncbi:MAG: N-acetylneuraminate synthase family protein [Treponema sp.]|nr:N-acetylneuraminate synthase family protein [Treponema sp.]